MMAFIRNSQIYPNDLEISFHRTVHVPDNGKMSKLPPSLANFRFTKLKTMQILCRIQWLQKAGYFYQCTMRIWQPRKSLIADSSVEREAMWINFKSRRTYGIKIFVRGVNIVAGEPAIETAATRLRRHTTYVNRDPF